VVDTNPYAHLAGGYRKSGLLTDEEAVIGAVTHLVFDGEVSQGLGSGRLSLARCPTCLNFGFSNTCLYLE
jgi:hypothetical protein